MPLAQKYGSIPVFWRSQLMSVVLTAPLAIAGIGDAHWNTGAAAALLSLGALGTAVAFIAMINLSTRVGSTRGSALTYLEAIIALALGAVFRHEKVLALEIIGSAVLLLGAWLVSRADR